MRAADIKLDYRGQAHPVIPGPTAQVIAVTSGSTGTGTTSIALNLAQAMRRSGRTPLLLDADLGASCTSARFGAGTVDSLHDVLDGSRSLQEVMRTGPDGIQVISAASCARQLASLDVLECAGMVRVFSALQDSIDTLVIDAAWDTGGCVASLCRAAGEIIVTVCPDEQSVAAVVHMIASLQHDYGVTRFRILPSQVSSAGEASGVFGRLLQHFATNHDVILNCCGFIPLDDHMLRAGRSGETILSAYPRSRAAMALRNLADRVMKWPRPGHAGGHLEFFVERMFQNDKINEEVRS
jgi:flagellar biosynthesis protein FlhG